MAQPAEIFLIGLGLWFGHGYFVEIFLVDSEMQSGLRNTWEEFCPDRYDEMLKWLGRWKGAKEWIQEGPEPSKIG